VIIAWARCAGAATAMLPARHGARVLLLDRSRYGTDTLSTHALMRGAVLQLHSWGLFNRVIHMTELRTLCVRMLMRWPVTMATVRQFTLVARIRGAPNISG
jgi:glycine/D-amino acid oxidase-like deaminating enzyme